DHRRGPAPPLRRVCRRNERHQDCGGGKRRLADGGEELMALSGSIARRYARALLEIGVARGTYEKMNEELGTLAGLIAKSKDLHDALTNPIFLLSQRKAVLAELASRLAVQKEVRSFLMLLMDRGRVAALADIARSLSAMCDEQAGRVRAKVTSPKALTDDYT